MTSASTTKVSSGEPSPNVGSSEYPSSTPNLSIPTPSSSQALSTMDGNRETIETDDSTETGTRKLTSIAWTYFKKQKIDGSHKAICNACKKKLGGESKNGTRHLLDHIKTCPKIKAPLNPQQMLLNHAMNAEGKTTLAPYAFDQEASRMELAKMIILHEFPLSVVEYIGFRSFVSTLQPSFKHISRNTVKSDIFKIYDVEREKTMRLLEKTKNRVALTTNMWTSNHQNKRFMVVTAHFIDKNWILQGRIIRFIYVPCPHTTEALCTVMMDCLLDWNIDRKISTVTVDNCSTNDAMIDKIRCRLDLSSLLVGGSLFHMRCCAHILNLIARDGLDVMGGAIDKIRDSVSYWSASPKREQMFDGFAKQLKTTYSKKLRHDCKTGWNSTFLMLTRALSYKNIFIRVALREAQYKSLPSEMDWEMAKTICDKLKIYFKVTEIFSGTKYPTVNLYFTFICDIKVALMKWVNDSNVVISRLTLNMLDKFNAYWEIIHGVLGVAVVLDPRYKMMSLEFYFPLIYGEVEAAYEINRIQKLVIDLLREYKVQSSQEDGFGIEESHKEEETTTLNDDSIDENIKNFDKFVENQTSGQDDDACELKAYLDQKLIPRTQMGFDILGWWRINGPSFPILRLIARDILVIPVSTVASESTFSTSGRWVSPHRSRLHPKTLEALMCCQNWLWAHDKDCPSIKDEDEEQSV